MNFKQNQWPFHLSRREENKGCSSKASGLSVPREGTPLFLHTLCVPPAGTHPAVHHAGLPTTVPVLPPPGMSSPRARVHRGHVDALLPQELQRDVPRSVGQRERGQTGRWGLRAPPRLKRKRWLTSASQACRGAAFVCMFLFAFVCLSVVFHLHPIKLCH